MNKSFSPYVREFPEVVKAVLAQSLAQSYQGFNDNSKVKVVNFTVVWVDEGRRNVALKEYASTWANVDYFITLGYDYIDDVMYVLKNSAYAA